MSAKGRALILIGHAGHPEVEGTMGQIPGRCSWCRPWPMSPRSTLPADTPVAYVTQTTLSVDDTRGIIAALHSSVSPISSARTPATSATRRRTARPRCAN